MRIRNKDVWVVVVILLVLGYLLWPVQEIVKASPNVRRKIELRGEIVAIFKALSWKYGQDKSVVEAFNSRHPPSWMVNLANSVHAPNKDIHQGDLKRALSSTVRYYTPENVSGKRLRDIPKRARLLVAEGLPADCEDFWIGTDGSLKRASPQEKTRQ